MTNLSNQFWTDPRMPYVEARRACMSRICYKAHSHPTFSIGAVDSGKSYFSSYLHTNMEISAGTVVTIPAYLEHSCNPLPNQTWSYQMMHLELNWVKQFFEETVAESFGSQIPELKPEIIHHPKIYQHFSHLNTMLFDSERTILEKEQLLIETLNQIIFPSLQLKYLNDKKNSTNLLSKLLEILLQHDDFISLEQLSRYGGISRYAIIRLFKKNFGLTPHAFQLNMRVNQARELLKKGKAIIHIAYDLGFVDQSHFYRVFKSLTGISPKDYQQHFSRNFIQE